ncbi:hypothetical protein Zmor_012658 [Zophobas morio]|uniref:Uncharacterized protein n=1 Tax=Zophobas morio TaxID=2755281 RepID=A0AA38IE10_9CUCU|nr:hypothetical protein Zmor_012658 [Zophobas morio]
MHKVLLLVVSLAASWAYPIDYGTQLTPAIVKEDPAAYPKYHFEYGVKDDQTGDIKEQAEERDGDVVKGEYSLIEPDGTLRKVQYQDDGKSGFNAIVTRGHSTHPAPKKVAVPVPVPLLYHH